MEENVKLLKKDTTDRISEIPECIIENILLRLDHPRERVRVSALSKKWFALSTSLPVLEFAISDFGKKDGIYCSNIRDSFYKYVYHTVSRFCRQQNVMNARTFNLYAVSRTDEELKTIDTCLALILLKGVTALEIKVYLSTYILPDILTSASSLTSLKVIHCVLPSSLMVDVPNFKSLKVLWLNDVRLDPPVIMHLTASCSLLEELIVKYCYGSKEFCVYGRLQNLKKAHFFYNRGFERIDIEAPNLCEFQLRVNYYMEGRRGTYVNLGLCKQLRTLILRGPIFQTSTGISEFLSNFPILENLSLCLFNRCNSLAVSSPSLRKLVLSDKCDLEDIDIITPNLLLFSYANSGYFYNSSELINISLGESNARMECHIINEVDTLWFQKLRRFLEKSDRFKFLNLDNHNFGKISVDFAQLKAIQLPPYELEYVKLAEWQTNQVSVVKGILWCCRPRSLSLTSKFSSISQIKRSHILKYICARLLQQEDKGTTNIRIEWSFPSQEKIYYSWKSMMPELPDHTIQTLTFIKEEVATKKKGTKPSKVPKCLDCVFL